MLKFIISERLLLNLILLCIFFGSVLMEGQNKQKPNIVYINVDDLGWTDLACYGSIYYETPNIDRLATKGMKFTDAYASAANCAPSRAGLLTGQYSPRHGIYTVNSSERGKAKDRKLIPIPNTVTLLDSIVTIAEALKKSGYVTASMGKWHLGKDPKTQGFDINIAGNHSGHPKTYFSPYKNKDLKDGPEGEYLTDRLTKEAIDFLRRHKNQTFFLYMTYYTVHTPIEGKEVLVKKYRRNPSTSYHNNAAYAAMIESMDKNVGRLLNTLEEFNLTDNTLIIFTSDNGGLFTVSEQFPLKYGKGSYYEGGTRVPLIVRWDGKIKANTIVNTPVINLDFYPTLLEITGTVKEKNQVQDGLSLAPVLFAKGPIDDRALYWHFPIYLEAQDGYNEFTGRDPLFRTRPGTTMRYGKWKLHQYFEDGAIELYNLDTDISERNNLAGTSVNKVSEMVGMMDGWRSGIKAPIPDQLNSRYINTE